MDLDRLRRTLGDPNLQWLVVKLRRRLERGRPLCGKLGLPGTTTGQRSSLGKLLGRTIHSGSIVTLSLDELNQILVGSDICASLQEAVETLSGPVVDLRQQALDVQTSWSKVYRDIERSPGFRPEMRPWLQDLEETGLLLRLSRKDLDVARLLLDQALEVAARLPAKGMSLAELAALAAGDSHALDIGNPLSAIVLRWVRRLTGLETLVDVEERRTAWASVGILCDELSAPVLVLNLRASGPSATARAMNVHADNGEPYRISTRQLLRDAPEFVGVTARNTVFVCENPGIVAIVANRLGPHSAPLISIEGQPKTAAHLLFTKLRAANVRLLYHGDFDWSGIRIGNLMLRRYGAEPWMFSAAEYLSAPRGRKLVGRPSVANWAPNLGNAMSARMLSVHEEAVVDSLIKDLDLNTTQG